MTHFILSFYSLGLGVGGDVWVSVYHNSYFMLNQVQITLSYPKKREGLGWVVTGLTDW